MSALPISTPAEASAHKRERRKEARPAELLAAALDLFVEKGFAATRVEEVAQRAGVSKGTLFLYFPSKEELLKEVVRHNITSQFAHWREGLAEFPGTVAAAVHLVAQGWWVHVGSTKASGITKLMVAEGQNFPELSRFYFEEVLIPGNQMLLELLKSGVDKGEFRADVNLPDAMHSLVSALFFLACTSQAHAAMACGLPAVVAAGSGQAVMVSDPPKFIWQHVEMLLHGLCVRPEAVAQAAAQATAFIDQIHAQENGVDCPGAETA